MINTFKNKLALLLGLFPSLIFFTPYANALGGYLDEMSTCVAYHLLNSSELPPEIDQTVKKIKKEAGIDEQAYKARVYTSMTWLEDIYAGNHSYDRKKGDEIAQLDCQKMLRYNLL